MSNLTGKQKSRIYNILFTFKARVEDELRGVKNENFKTLPIDWAQKSILDCLEEES